MADLLRLDDGPHYPSVRALCVVAGTRSDTTFSTYDRWRALVMATCTDVPGEFSVWLKPVKPGR